MSAINDLTKMGVRPTLSAMPESGIIEMVYYGWSRYGRDNVIGLWSGEGDVATPPHVVQAANAALIAGDTFYGPSRGSSPLRNSLAHHLNALYDIDCTEDRVTVTVGAMQGIVLSFQALLQPDDEVLVPTPIWPNVFHAVEVAHGRPVLLPMTLETGRWRLDLDALFDAVTPRTRAIFINSPGNPTGWMPTRDEMVAIRDFARQRGLWIVSDEVYSRIVYHGDVAPSFLEICEPEDRLIVVNSFSKSWAMTGWRVGWLTAPPALGPILENLMQFGTMGVAPFVQQAALNALQSGDAMTRRVRDLCRGGREVVFSALGNIDRVSFAQPDGAFYAFFRVDGEPDARALCMRLLDDVQVGLAPGSAFGPGGEAYVRLCFASQKATLERAMDRLTSALIK